MDNLIPADAILGNRCFDFDADPGYYELLEQGLEAARKEATPLPTADPTDWVAPDGTINPVKAGEFYNAARDFLETDIFNFVDRYSPAAWLWYLRKLPIFFFDFEDLHASAYATSDLAEITTSRPGDYVGTTEPESLKPLRYGWSGDVNVDLVHLCGKIHVLRLIHQRIRTAGKEVEFRYVPGDLPVPAPTASQQQALQSYDRRRAKQHLFAKGTGTPLRALGSHPDAVLVAVKDFAGRQVVPHKPYDADAGQFFAGQERPVSQLLRPVRTAEGVEISSKFTLREVSLPDLKLFSAQHLSGAAYAEAAQLIMLLRLVRKMLIAENPAYRVFEASQTGYILETAERFLEHHLRASFDELAEASLRLIPEAPIPANADALLAGLEAMTGSSWPMVFGPVIRRVDDSYDSLMIDIYSATMRLDHIISFKPVTGGLANQRARYFEDTVQRVIDDSPWGDVPAELKALRRRKRLRRTDRTALTDIDAIGVLGDTVLIVDGKSRIQSPADLFLGTHRVARNNADWLEKEVKKCRKTECYLREHPRSPNGSYDFSEFKHLVVVACTSEPVYVELEMVRNVRPEVTELLSTQEVMPGLPAAVSIFELAEWLHSHPHSGNI
jgi:hypothetical protein